MGSFGQTEIQININTMEFITNFQCIRKSHGGLSMSAFYFRHKVTQELA